MATMRVPLVTGSHIDHSTVSVRLIQFRLTKLTISRHRSLQSVVGLSPVVISSGNEVACPAFKPLY